MAMALKRLIRIVLGALLLTGLLSTGSVSHAATTPPDPIVGPGASTPDDAAELLVAVRHLQATGGSAHRGAAAQAAPCGLTSMQVVSSISGTGLDTTVSLTGDSRTFTLKSIPASWWANPPVTSPVWRLYFQGFMWVGYVAHTQNDPVVTERLVDLALEFIAANPDPGISARGWDEGTNLRREQQLNCLYSLTQDARLIPAITMSPGTARFATPPANPPTPPAKVERSILALLPCDWTNAARAAPDAMPPQIGPHAKFPIVPAATGTVVFLVAGSRNCMSIGLIAHPIARAHGLSNTRSRNLPILRCPVGSVYRKGLFPA